MPFLPMLLACAPHVPPSVPAGAAPDPLAALAECHGQVPEDIRCVSASAAGASGWRCTFSGEGANHELIACPAWGRFTHANGGLSMFQESKRQGEGWSTRWWLTGPAELDPAVLVELERLSVPPLPAPPANGVEIQGPS